MVRPPTAGAAAAAAAVDEDATPRALAGIRLLDTTTAAAAAAASRHTSSGGGGTGTTGSIAGADTSGASGSTASSHPPWEANLASIPDVRGAPQQFTDPPAAVAAAQSAVTWTTAERSIFLALHATHGKDWRRVAAGLPTKSHRDVVRHYYDAKVLLGLGSRFAKSAGATPAERAATFARLAAVPLGKARAAVGPAGVRRSSGGGEGGGGGGGDPGPCAAGGGMAPHRRSMTLGHRPPTVPAARRLGAVGGGFRWTRPRSSHRTRCDSHPRGRWSCRPPPHGTGRCPHVPLTTSVWADRRWHMNVTSFRLRMKFGRWFACGTPLMFGPRPGPTRLAQSAFRWRCTPAFTRRSYVSTCRRGASNRPRPSATRALRLRRGGGGTRNDRQVRCGCRWRGGCRPPTAAAAPRAMVP